MYRLALALVLAGTGSVGAQSVETSAGPMAITPLVEGLEEPWAVAPLPGGGALLTEVGGRLLLWDGTAITAVSGAPSVVVDGQGGLLDVMIPADFAASRQVWLTYATAVDGGTATAAGMGRLSDDGTRLDGFTQVFAGEGRGGGRHFGSRLVEAADGTIYVTTGDRGTGPRGLDSQDPRNAIGKIIHLTRDGTPATARDGWRPGVFSLGHRNAQGAALGQDGVLLTVEHGARGGDEVNRVEAGRNYGWPVITYGRNYTGFAIGEGTAKEGMEQPLHYWDPSIAPSGLMVYSGALVPEWRGDLFFGSLNSDFLGRLDPDTPAETGFAEERIASPQTGRVRDVVEAPDGSIWFLSVYDGALYRLAPAG
jgi:aldose sugar dehydrogenase